MKIIKRSQLAILSLSFMVMIAGYINYKYDPERERNLGQTVHVNSGDVFLYEATNAEDVAIYEEANRTTDKIYDNKKNNSSIATFKTQRDNMFSELEATYAQAMKNTESSDVKVEYQKKLDELINKKHIIGIIESLIGAKGIDNIVIIPTESGISVIVNREEKLTDKQISLIQKIIQDELKIEASKITIMQE
ncbi:MAG: SpoIIIAH-like family protein [Clostridia bacterium]|nr:SpoIIIAH-like family protein [Clostridia bacterium]